LPIEPSREGNGYEALDQVRRRTFDLIIAD
jgi:hypothetical protein